MEKSAALIDYWNAKFRYSRSLAQAIMTQSQNTESGLDRVAGCLDAT